MLDCRAVTLDRGERALDSGAITLDCGEASIN
jgi:hypothetical protein